VPVVIGGEARWQCDWAGGDAGFGRRDRVGLLALGAPKYRGAAGLRCCPRALLGVKVRESYVAAL